MLASACICALAGYVVTGSSSAYLRVVRRLRMKTVTFVTRLGGSPIVYALFELSYMSCLRTACVKTLAKRQLVVEQEFVHVLVLSVLGLAIALPFVLTRSFEVLALVAVSIIGLLAGLYRAQLRHRQREVLHAMPGILRTISVGLAAGQTLPQTIAYVGKHTQGPAGEAFSNATLRLRCGLGLEEVIAALSAELNHSSADLLGSALVISHRTGAPLQGLLSRSATLVEKQSEFERLILVKTAQVRLSVRIVSLLPVSVVLLLALTSRDFIAGLVTPVGMSCICIAAFLDGIALVIIRMLMRKITL